MSKPIKVLLVGPKHSGKSCMANHLASLADITGKQYSATKALRIVEFERKITFRGKSENVNVELWDCSGDQTFSSCWPAILQDTDGILFLYSPIENQESELKSWYDRFFISQRLKPNVGLVFAHFKSLNEKKLLEPLQEPLNKFPREETCLDAPSERYKQAFDGLLSNILIAKQERDEESVLQRR